jgi:hypothetical protein
VFHSRNLRFPLGITCSHERSENTYFFSFRKNLEQMSLMCVSLFFDFDCSTITSLMLDFYVRTSVCVKRLV